MARFGLKTAFPMAFILGLACAVPAATVAQAQGSRDPANQRNLNDPATQRNLNDHQDPNKSRLNDPANKRGTTGAAATPSQKNDKGDKKDMK